VKFISTDDILVALLAGPDANADWRSSLESYDWLRAIRFDDPAIALERAARSGRTLFLLDSSLAEADSAFWIDLLRSCALGPLVWVGEASASEPHSLVGELTLRPSELPTEERDWRAWADQCWTRFASVRSGKFETDDSPVRPSCVDDAFIADSLHEFRTPITVVQQFASLIHDGLAGEVSERQIEYLQRIRVASRHIVTLFDDFRLSTRARLGAMPKVRGRVALSGLLIACAAEVGPERVQVDIGVPGSTVSVHGDDEMLSVVLSRLASNSCQRSKDGERVRLGIGSIDEDTVDVVMRYRGQCPTDHEIEVFEAGVLQDGVQRRSVTKVFGVGVELARTLLLFGGGELFLSRLSDDEGEVRVRLPLYMGRAT
jgi:signal transduction histidine kinase